MTWELSRTIYRILCLETGESYIGQTGDYKGRMRAHKLDLNRGTHQNHKLQSAYANYGIRSFYFEIVEVVNRSDSDTREIHWVNYYDSYFNGFNLTLGGNKHFGWPYIIQQSQKH
jgi:group I intron endonuclease